MLMTNTDCKKKVLRNRHVACQGHTESYLDQSTKGAHHRCYKKDPALKVINHIDSSYWEALNFPTYQLANTLAPYDDQVALKDSKCEKNLQGQVKTNVFDHKDPLHIIFFLFYFKRAGHTNSIDAWTAMWLLQFFIMKQAAGAQISRLHYRQNFLYETEGESPYSALWGGENTIETYSTDDEILETNAGTNRLAKDTKKASIGYAEILLPKDLWCNQEYKENVLKAKFIK